MDVRAYAGILPILGSAALSPAAIFTSYNVVVTNNYTDQSHVQGTTYANNLDAINVPDFARSSAAGTGDTLTVTGNITGSTITLERGVFRYAQSTAPSANLNGGSTEVHDPTISITDLANQLSNAAAFYASQPNTTVTPAGSNLNLTASGSGATYFDEPASDLDQSNENVTLTAGAGQFIIVVVPDASFSFGSSEHITLGGSTSGEQIMWDFPNATTVSLDDSLWTGSLLAPGADPDRQQPGHRRRRLRRKFHPDRRSASFRPQPHPRRAAIRRANAIGSRAVISTAFQRRQFRLYAAISPRATSARYQGRGRRRSLKPHRDAQIAVATFSRTDTIPIDSDSWPSTQVD